MSDGDGFSGLQNAISRTLSLHFPIGASSSTVAEFVSGTDQYVTAFTHVSDAVIQTQIDEAFKDAGNLDEGQIRVWRVEKLQVVPWPERRYGEFHQGDSYLVLAAVLVPLKDQPDVKTKHFHVFFWEGSQSTQDEIAVAAIKSTELARALEHGKVTQHRECEGFESELFLSFFPYGINLLEGGIDSALNRVESEEKMFRPRLFQLKGKKSVRVSQVDPSVASLNSGDVFILDTYHVVYQWNGKESNIRERAKGLELSLKMKSRGWVKKVVLSMDEGDLPRDAEEEKFWAYLGGPGPIASAEQGGDDLAHERNALLELYRIDEVDDDVQIVQIPKTDLGLSYSMLDTNHVLLLDCDTELFVWCGKQSTKGEKLTAIQMAQDLLKEIPRPEWTPIVTMMESAETAVFQSKFSDWPQALSPPTFVDYASLDKSFKLDRSVLEYLLGPLPEDDDSDVIQRSEAKEEKKEVFSGRADAVVIPNFTADQGDLTVYRVGYSNLIPIGEEEMGLFFSDQSYIVLFSSTEAPDTFPSNLIYLLYFWRGRDCSVSPMLKWKFQLEKELSKSIWKREGVKPYVFETGQFREPDHLLSLFKSRLVYLAGRTKELAQKPQDEKFEIDEKEEIADLTLKQGTSGRHRMFHIRGFSNIDVRALEVEPKAKFLNSGDVFMLLTPTTLYIWYGRFSNDPEVDLSEQVATRLLGGRQLVVLDEESETDDFWAALGGKAIYTYMEDNLNVMCHQQARFLTCSLASGQFRVEDIPRFTQDDLVNEHVAMIDAYYNLYIWEGLSAHPEEKYLTMELALRYTDILRDREPERGDFPIVLIKPGKEPVEFTAMFHGWEKDRLVHNNSYIEKHAHLESRGLKGKVLPNTVPSTFQVA